MKTPLQELLERVQGYRDAETSPLVVSRLNSVCVDILGMLEKEKEAIMNAYDIGWSDAKQGKDLNDLYYNETFSHKEE